ncbi:MAG: oxygen-independent coproporphyrinogen III oxidase [Hyphomonadaceae bacterium]
MDSRLLKYAELDVPRYTSYPTAPHFNESVDGAVYARWLSELPPEASISLYIHVPYCQRMCWYCGCHAFAVRRDEPVAQYVEALECEIECVVGVSGAKSVREIHWGGGTPNSLNPERFEAIVDRLAQRFDLSRLERHAIELDPRLLTDEQAQTFARCGVNRASLGVQDLDVGVQVAIGREQPFECVRDAANRLRDVGVAALSFDLMYGLPHQTLETVRRTAELAASLRPDRFSVFGYAHVPWFKARQRLISEAALPGTEARFELAEAIAETLRAAGYVSIGYDHYALPSDPIARAARAGELRRNFQGFVEYECDALIGLGPSSISTLPQGYAQNEPNVSDWQTKAGSGEFSTCRGRALSMEDRQRRDLIMRLLCDFELTLDSPDNFRRELSELAPLVRDGLVELDDGRISVPPAARPFARIVANVFDTYRQEGAARHSRAV